MITPKLSWQLGLFAILGFWGLVAFQDFPAPFIDDTWFVGAAINLSQHGVFSNPYCESMQTLGSAQLFLTNMPLHSYILAAWLWLFGISALSFHLFYTLLALLNTLLVYRLFPASRSSLAAAVFLALMVYGFLGGVGLRADSLGLCFLIAGLDIWRVRTVAGFFRRSLFWGLAIITFPSVGLVAMVLFLAALFYQRLFCGRTLKELIPFVLMGGMALGLCFLLFLVCIHGELRAFLACLAKTQHLSSAGIKERFQFFTLLGIAKWVVVQITFLILLAILAYRNKPGAFRREHFFFLGLAALLFTCLGFASMNSATGAHLWALVCLIIILYILTYQNSSWLAWGAFTLLLLVAGFGHAHVAIQQVLANHPLRLEEKEAVRAKVKSLQPRRLYVDAYAMREIYDYRLPPDTYCFETSSTTGWGQPTTADTLPKNSVAVVSVGSAFPTLRSPEAGNRSIPLKIFGYALPGVRQNPYDLEIIDNRD